MFSVMRHQAQKIRVSRICEGSKQLCETHLPAGTRTHRLVLEKKNLNMTVILLLILR